MVINDESSKKKFLSTHKGKPGRELCLTGCLVVLYSKDSRVNDDFGCGPQKWGIISHTLCSGLFQGELTAGAH